MLAKTVWVSIPVRMPNAVFQFFSFEMIDYKFEDSEMYTG